MATEVSAIIKVLKGEGQAIWTISRSSTAMKLYYCLSLCYPYDMNEAKKEIDHLLLSMVQKAFKITIPMNEEDETVCPKPGVNRLLRKSSYQNWMLRSPLRLGGMGLRSIVETSLVAFIGGVEQSVQHFMGEDGLCKQLEQVFRHMDQS